MIRRDWLTLALIKAIKIYHPNAEGVIVRNINNSYCRDIDTCRDNCKILFPVGCVFASRKQLEQAIQHFSKGWKALTVFYNQAMHASRGHAKLNLDNMDALLVVLKETP